MPSRRKESKRQLMSLELSVSNIFKSYEGEPVLKGCSFNFDKKQTYVLMGRNGSGKSTLLRICSLIEEPDKGELIFSDDGVPVEKDLGLRRRITLLLPRIGVFNTTVYRNVAYGLRIRRLDERETGERVNRALDFVGLAHKRDQKALTLSSGEMQRLGIARAMVIRPEIMFLDEPTASIDQRNTEIIEEIILNLKKEQRSIALVTTHDVAQAKRLADRLLVIQEGKIVG
jgi:tungstate transport system ATP-binding protein